MSTTDLHRDVTMVIPVFGSPAETVACVQSLLDSDAAGCPILLNDDASPDGTGALLRESFAAIPNVMVRSNFRNRGYTANVQFGVDEARTPYVAVINSDTLFPQRWLGKLVAALHANPNLAAVGPLSNAASYQSIPGLRSGSEFAANPGFGLSAEGREAINLWLENTVPGLSADLPILNGFCTLFRTESLRRAGGYDPVSFPTGYGEENDLCMRLMMSGARLAAVLDCFVHHLKSRSFGSEKKREYSRLGREALARLYGEGFVPAYADVMEGNGILNALRFAAAATFGDADPRGLRIETATASQLLANGDAATRLVKIVGPSTTTIWHDRIDSGPADPTAAKGGAIGLVVGSGYLIVTLPEGVGVTVAAGAPLGSALAACALWSHFVPVAVAVVEANDRHPDIRAALDALRFRFLYLDPLEDAPAATGIAA